VKGHIEASRSLSGGGIEEEDLMMAIERIYPPAKRREGFVRGGVGKRERYHCWGERAIGGGKGKRTNKFWGKRILPKFTQTPIVGKNGKKKRAEARKKKRHTLDQKGVPSLNWKQKKKREMKKNRQRGLPEETRWSKEKERPSAAFKAQTLFEERTIRLRGGTNL